MSEQLEKAKAEIAAKVAEYTALAGKTFKRKDGKGRVAKVIGYVGIATILDGKKAHLINANDGQSDWTPVASKFLEEYEEVSE